MFGLSLFGSSEPSSPQPALSIIGGDTTIRGETISGAGDLRIEGTVHADIMRDGDVIIAPEGTVHGTVRAETIHVAGRVRGELHAEEELVLEASADVRARLQARDLTVEPGASFKGTVHYEVSSSSEKGAPSGDCLPASIASVDDARRIGVEDQDAGSLWDGEEREETGNT